MVKVTGKQAVSAKIRRLGGAEAVKEIGKVLFVAANRIQVTAQHSITEGSTSGRGHVASKPGEPPNADTHGLDRQIETELVQPLKAVVSSNAPYSRFLEFGTSRMAARPFMMPAAEKERKAVVGMVRDAVNRVVHGRTSGK